MNQNEPSPQSQESGKGNLKKYLLIGGIGCVVVIAAVAALIFLVFRLTAGPVDVVNKQLEAVREGDLQKAYEYCSAAFKQSTSYDQFVSFVNAYSVLKNAKEFSSSNREISGDRATLDGTVIGNDGTKQPAEFMLIKENNEWKVLNIRLTGSGVSEKREEEPAPQPEKIAEPLPQQEQVTDQSDQAATAPNETAEAQTDQTASPAGALQIEPIDVQKQPASDTTIVQLQFRVVNFANEKTGETFRVHLVQDLKTYDPEQNLLKDLSQDGIKELSESGLNQEHKEANFRNTLTIPKSAIPGTYKATVTVHDRIRNGTAEASTEFEIP